MAVMPAFVTVGIMIRKVRFSHVQQRPAAKAFCIKSALLCTEFLGALARGLERRKSFDRWRRCFDQSGTFKIRLQLRPKWCVWGNAVDQPLEKWLCVLNPLILDKGDRIKIESAWISRCQAKRSIIGELCRWREHTFTMRDQRIAKTGPQRRTIAVRCNCELDNARGEIGPTDAEIGLGLF